MELRHLRYFIAVADHGSVVEASRRLYIAQSAISEQIADLESELGGQLFSRQGRKLTLTGPGKIFLAEARKIVSASTHATALFKRSSAGQIGTLSIGFFVWGIGPFFAKIIREFRREYPGVELELHDMFSREQLDALGSGKIDVGFGRPVDAPYDRIFSSEVLYNEEIMVLLPPDHRLAGGPVQVADLAAEPFIMCNRETIGVRYNEFLELCRASNFEPEVVATARSWNGVVSLVEAGAGIALAPSGVRRVSSEGVVTQPLTPKAVDVGIAITWNPANESPFLKRFLEIVQAHKPSLEEPEAG